MFKKEKNFKFSVTIDGEVVYVNEKVWRHIRELVEKINELHEDNNMKKRELDSLKPIVETKEYKPAIGEECVDCKYVVLNRWNNHPVGCRKGNVCEDFMPGVKED